METDVRHLVETIQSMRAELQTIEVKKAHDGCPKRLFDTLSSFSNQDEGGFRGVRSEEARFDTRRT